MASDFFIFVCGESICASIAKLSSEGFLFLPVTDRVVLSDIVEVYLFTDYSVIDSLLELRAAGAK